jgi:hypothetical protein
LFFSVNHGKKARFAEMRTQTAARLWVLLAAREPVGVIFRRGPSKQVMLIKWNTRADTFEFGQWLKGRVYERRSDVSPDGELLIYFAASQKPPLRSWTAISKPPYFTALALWPKGDCWNGGGWFVEKRKIRLNHGPTQTKLQSGFQLGPIKIAGYAQWRGEDDTVWEITLARDNWKKTAEGKETARGGIKGWIFDPPQEWRKPHPKKQELSLTMSIVAIAGPGAPWYQLKYRVSTPEGIALDLGLIDWADWDQREDLVFARKGALFRQKFHKLLPRELRQIADFNDLKFTGVSAPAKARRW